MTALAGAALLLRDDRRRGTYIAGCIFFAATMLVRAQNVLMAWPWIVASWRRLRARRGGEVIAGTVLIVVLVVTGYGIAAKLTGIDEYIFATKWHQHYVATVDGALNPTRTPMRFLLQDFLFDPFESRAASTLMFFFTLLAFLRPRRAHTGTFVAVQGPELDSSGIRIKTHRSAQGINFPNHMTLGQTTHRWIAGHLADGVQVLRQHHGLASQSRPGHGRLDPGMAPSDH